MSCDASMESCDQKLNSLRELAFQISEQFEALGGKIGVKCGKFHLLHFISFFNFLAVIVGGVDMMTQALALAKKPHVVIATPGRLVDHLENTKGFSLRSVKYLVMDEADRILNMDFGEEVRSIPLSSSSSHSFPFPLFGNFVFKNLFHC